MTPLPAWRCNDSETGSTHDAILLMGEGGREREYAIKGFEMSDGVVDDFDLVRERRLEGVDIETALSADTREGVNGVLTSERERRDGVLVLISTWRSTLQTWHNKLL
jgi:hypothetical protein